MKRILSENKVLLVLAIVIIISLVIICVSMIMYFYTGNGKDAYGDRLEGIEKVKISDNIDSDIEKIYADTTAFNEVIVNIKGKIIYINIDIKENLSLVDAQSLAIKSLEAFSEEEKSFYDIQIIITTKTTEEKSEIYPLMGYKNAKNSQVVWTN